jgi:transmembrane 9 superfamily protein 2/4
MSVLFVFLNLCAFDYNWWWKSFIMGCSPVIYLVIYSIIYCFYLKISSLSAIAVYFGIMGIIWAMISLISGSMSLFFNFAFLKIIYSKLRKD